MKPLDLYTLLYVIGAISLLFALVMFLFHKSLPTIKGPLLWSYGSLSAVISVLLFAAYPVVSGYIAYVVGGTFTVMAVSFYLAGTRVYKELQVNYLILYGLVFLQLFFGTLFYSVFPMPNVRMITFSSINLVGLILIIREFVQPAPKAYRLAFILCSIVFGISALTSLFRIFSVINLLPGKPHAPTLANLLFYFMSNVTQALLMFSFLLLISVKISERLKLKVEAHHKFFSIIAHDLSGPVGLISVMLNLVNTDNEFSEQQKSSTLQETEELSKSTHQLLQNLLYWSRNQLDNLRPAIQEFDLNNVILENLVLLQQISKTKDIEIDYQPNQQLNCMGDLRMIETVVRNLISNSIKFTNSGGRIIISVERTGTNLILKIADNGVGMSKKTQENLFQFSEITSKVGTHGEHGTGLGLLLCKEFVEANNGTLIVNSQEGIGTELIITLLCA